MTQISAPYVYNVGRSFHDTAERCASLPALVSLDGSVITYGELEKLSNRTAAWLLCQGVVSGDVVAIFNCKTHQAFACMIACLKLGVAYVNLDPSSPVERLKKMLITCAPKLIWDHSDSNTKRLALGDDWPPVFNYSTELFARELERLPASFPEENKDVHGSCIAYIMFTSGSTGFPKGAAITHSNLLGFMAWSRNTFSITEEDRLTNLNPMHFDNSVFDFYTAMFSGASMVPVPEDALKNPRSMLNALNSKNCTVWFSVPSLIVYTLKMRAMKEIDLPTLRLMAFGGEGFPKASLRALAKLLMPRIRLVNVYGPTECTCICSSYEVTNDDLFSDELLPLGPIAPNFSHLIVDEQDRLVVDGEIGELLIGGPNVGVGYYRDAEKSSVAFLQNPFHSNFRDIFYRTGDLVRYDAKRGVLLFCGRKDNQVKQMGHRIELEEIEFAIGALSYILETVVVFHRDQGGAGRIIAFVNATRQDEISLVEDLREKLPSYMIPNKVIFTGDLPKNQNGKIDRKIVQSWKLDR